MDLASKLYATRLGMTATSVEHPVDQDGGKTAAFPHRGFITMRQTGGESRDGEREGDTERRKDGRQADCRGINNVKMLANWRRTETEVNLSLSSSEIHSVQFRKPFCSQGHCSQGMAWKEYLHLQIIPTPLLWCQSVLLDANSAPIS